MVPRGRSSAPAVPSRERGRGGWCAASRPRTACPEAARGTRAARRGLCEGAVLSCWSPAGTSTRCAPGPTGSWAGSMPGARTWGLPQELKCTDEQFPSDPVRALGYHPVLFGQKTYNGVAILRPRRAGANRARVPRRWGRRSGSGVVSATVAGRVQRDLGLRARRARRSARPPTSTSSSGTDASAAGSTCGHQTDQPLVVCGDFGTWLRRSGTSGTPSCGRARRSSRCPSGRR